MVPEGAGCSGSAAEVRAWGVMGAVWDAGRGAILFLFFAQSRICPMLALCQISILASFIVLMEGVDDPSLFC